MSGSALLFWGAMTGRPLLGLILALVVEARHWTRLRWDFDDDACSRAWQFSTLAIALAAVLIWLDGSRYTALPNLLTWMPLLLMPVQFVQSYGLRDSLPVSAFSFLARYHRARNERLGLKVATTRFHFGHVLFATCMVAATVGSRADSKVFLPGVVLLTAWTLLATGRCRPASLLPMLALATLAGYGGKPAIQRLEDWLGRGGGGYKQRFDPSFSGTMIGSAGDVIQSPDIIWRLRPNPGHPPPPLLRTAGFNIFLGSGWHAQRVPAADFLDLDSRLIGDRSFYLLERASGEDPAVAGGASPAADPARLPVLPSFRLRGAVSEGSPLPLPGDAAGLVDFELEGIERNSFGTVRVFPKDPVIDGAVHWKGGGYPELPPIPHEDLRLPVIERQTIHEVVEKLGLRDEHELMFKLAAIRTWFHREFRYSRSLVIRRGAAIRKGATPLHRFLNDVRSGHCEYFATAAALMLRDLGVPARYATGYAVVERDVKRGGYVIRGTHGHAWCRVWDAAAGRWIDFDPTPPDWLASATPGADWMQRFNDAVQRAREDFFVWRSRPANRLGVSLGMLGLGLGLAVFIARRLWRSRYRVAAGARDGSRSEGGVRTPLHDLEAPLRRLLGQRMPGETFITWLSRADGRFPQPVLAEAVRLHQQLRFDPQAPPAEARDRLERLARELASSLKPQ